MRKLLAAGFVVGCLAVSGWVLLVAAGAGGTVRPLDLPVAAAASGPAEFFGVELEPSFVWCLDTSCSMGWVGGLETLRYEVMRTVEQLDACHQFSIVEFGTGVTTWSPTLVEATPTATASALEFTATLNADGTTCLLNGITAALDIANMASGDVSILLAGDGPESCVGGTLSPTQIVAAVSAANPTAIPIHCFYISPSPDGFPTYAAIADAFGGELQVSPESIPATPSPSFVRGDVNGDGVLEVSDVVAALDWLFLGVSGNCFDALDGNDDGAVSVADPVFLLGALFGGTGAPPFPYPDCGEDPTPDGLGCAGGVAGCPFLDFEPFHFSVDLPGANDSVAGDFDGDGILDVVVLHGEPSSLTLFVGTGAGDFDVNAPMPLPGNLIRMASGDLDNDGVLDLVLSGIGDVTDDLMVVLGNGDGTFVVSSVSAAILGILNPVLGDLDNDGNVDLVATSYGVGVDVLWVRFGNGDGTFGPAASYPVGNIPDLAFLRDFNGDGNLDLAAGAGYPATLTVYLGDGTGGFGSAQVTDLPSLGPGQRGLEFGDMDGDGVLDLVVLVQLPFAIEIHRGLGDGTFTFQSSKVLPSQGFRLALGDLDLDGDLDVLEGGAQRIGVYLGDGTGGLEEYATIPVNPGSQAKLILIDADQDSDLDVFTAPVFQFGLQTVQLTDNLLVP